MNVAAQINCNLSTVKLSGLAIVSSLIRACGSGGSGATEPGAAAADAATTPASPPSPAPAACAAASSVSWDVNGNSSAKDITSLTTGSATFGDHHAR